VVYYVLRVVVVINGMPLSLLVCTYIQSRVKADFHVLRRESKSIIHQVWSRWNHVNLIDVLTHTHTHMSFYFIHCYKKLKLMINLVVKDIDVVVTKLNRKCTQCLKRNCKREQYSLCFSKKNQSLLHNSMYFSHLLDGNIIKTAMINVRLLWAT